MKRSASATPSESDGTPSPPSKRVKSTTSTPTKRPAAASAWTPEKKGALVEYLLTVAIRSAKPDDMAKVTGLTKKQISDATCRGRNNLRQKLIDFAREAPATGSMRKSVKSEDDE